MAQLQNVEILLYHKTHLPHLKVYCNRYSPIWMKNIAHYQANTRIWNRSWLLKRIFFENLILLCTGRPTKMSLFFLANNFYKNKEAFKIFSPQILKVYRILLVETTLESIMFYYNFSVINTMFVPCIVLLYDSTAVTRTLKLSTTLFSISCGIRLISFLMMSSLVCGLFSQTLSFRYPSEDCQVGWDLGNRMVRGYWLYVIWVCPIGSYTWGIQVFCSRNEVATPFSHRTEHLNTSGIASHGMDSFRVKPIPLAILFPRSQPTWLFSEGVPERQSLRKQSTDKRGHHQERNQMDFTRNG